MKTNLDAYIMFNCSIKTNGNLFNRILFRVMKYGQGTKNKQLPQNAIDNTLIKRLFLPIKEHQSFMSI